MTKSGKFLFIICLMLITPVIFISCSKYDCYENTHIPDFRIVCGVKHHDTFDPRSTRSAAGTSFLNSFGFDFKGEAYSGVDESDIATYTSALVDSEFSQSTVRSSDGVLCFARNKDHCFSVVLIVYRSHDLSENQVAVYYEEYEGDMSEEQFEQFLNNA